MSTFYDRLLNEKKELDEKWIKLKSFLESDKIIDLNPVQISLLNIQEKAMATYSQILAERLSWLTKEE